MTSVMIATVVSIPLLSATALHSPPVPAFSAFALQTPEPAWRFWLAALTDVATLIIALALLITVVILLVIALQVRKLLRKVDPLLSQVRGHVDPVMGHVRDVGENVNYMTSAIRADVQQVTELIDGTRRRLNQSIEAAEHRVRELNAVLNVVQEEAERVFVDTAATIRGVQVGAGTYQRLRADGASSAPAEPVPPER
jgi:uncharacterized protein YoxC